MKLLLDEMYGPAVAEGLRRLGHDVTAVQEISALRSASDADLVEVALGEGRAIVTENVPDFLEVANRRWENGLSVPGLVLVTNRAFPRAHRHTSARLVVALDALINRGGIGEGERHWLR